VIAEDFLDLLDQERPGRPLPTRLRLLLPDPMTAEGWQRFHHEDIEDLDPNRRRWESLRLRSAAASLPYERVPRWVVRRLVALRAK
jgi:hypothetical protein